MTAPRLDVAEGERLEAAATPGPWFSIGPPWNHESPYINAGCSDPHGGRILFDTSVQWDDTDDDEAKTPNSDSALVCYLRNHARELLALARYAEQARPVVEAADYWDLAADDERMEAAIGLTRAVDEFRARQAAQKGAQDV